jgi:DNA-binding NarL/FixJ family response regulator
MDLKMPGIPAADAIRTIRAQYPATQVLVLTSYAEDRQVEDALRAGALGYALKSIVAADLVRAVATVARGETWLHAEAQRSLVNRMRRPAELSPLALRSCSELGARTGWLVRATVRSVVRRT